MLVATHVLRLSVLWIQANVSGASFGESFASDRRPSASNVQPMQFSCPSSTPAHIFNSFVGPSSQSAFGSGGLSQTYCNSRPVESHSKPFSGFGSSDASSSSAASFSTSFPSSTPSFAFQGSGSTSSTAPAGFSFKATNSPAFQAVPSSTSSAGNKGNNEPADGAAASHTPRSAASSSPQAAATASQNYGGRSTRRKVAGHPRRQSSSAGNHSFQAGASQANSDPTGQGTTSASASDTDTCSAFTPDRAGGSKPAFGTDSRNPFRPSWSGGSPFATNEDASRVPAHGEGNGAAPAPDGAGKQPATPAGGNNGPSGPDKGGNRAPAPGRGSGGPPAAGGGDGGPPADGVGNTPFGQPQQKVQPRLQAGTFVQVAPHAAPRLPNCAAACTYRTYISNCAKSAQLSQLSDIQSWLKPGPTRPQGIPQHCALQYSTRGL